MKNKDKKIRTSVFYYEIYTRISFLELSDYFLIIDLKIKIRWDQEDEFSSISMFLRYIVNLLKKIFLGIFSIDNLQRIKNLNTCIKYI